MADDIDYSAKYNDDIYEYRHVILPLQIAKNLPSPLRLLNETEWRALGLCQSIGWIHYMLYGPEPHVLLFRRPLAQPEVERSGLLSPTPGHDTHKLPLAPIKISKEEEKLAKINIVKLPPIK